MLVVFLDTDFLYTSDFGERTEFARLKSFFFFQKKTSRLKCQNLESVEECVVVQ